MQLSMHEIDLVCIQPAKRIRRCVHVVRNATQFSYELLQLFAECPDYILTCSSPDDHAHLVSKYHLLVPLLVVEAVSHDFFDSMRPCLRIKNISIDIFTIPKALPFAIMTSPS